jgi:hypothetical protein
MGSLHSILPLLPVRSALDFISAQPDTEGRVIVTVVCGLEEVELSFTVEEFDVFLGNAQDAADVARGIERG